MQTAQGAVPLDWAGEEPDDAFARRVRERLLEATGRSSAVETEAVETEARVGAGLAPGGAEPSGGGMAAVALGPGGKLSDADFQRIVAASGTYHAGPCP